MSETGSSNGLEIGADGSSDNTINGAFSLENILGENHDEVQHLASRVAPTTGWDEENIERPLAEGYCVECEGNLYQQILTTVIFIPSFPFFIFSPLDQPAKVFCEICSDPYCEVCFAAQHRKGSRKQHTVKHLASKEGVKAEVNGEATVAKASDNGEPVSQHPS
jgi:hypothetical protein